MELLQDFKDNYLISFYKQVAELGYKSLAHLIKNFTNEDLHTLTEIGDSILARFAHEKGIFGEGGLTFKSQRFLAQFPSGWHLVWNNDRTSIEVQKHLRCTDYESLIDPFTEEKYSPPKIAIPQLVDNEIRDIEAAGIALDVISYESFYGYSKIRMFDKDNNLLLEHWQKKDYPGARNSLLEIYNLEAPSPQSIDEVFREHSRKL